MLKSIKNGCGSISGGGSDDALPAKTNKTLFQHSFRPSTGGRSEALFKENN